MRLRVFPHFPQESPRCLVSFEEVASVTSSVGIDFYSHIAEFEVENFLWSISHHTGKTGQGGAIWFPHRTALIESIHPKVSENFKNVVAKVEMSA